MKKYQKATLIAKNMPSGSYAAGCPAGNRDNEPWDGGKNNGYGGCINCERTA